MRPRSLFFLATALGACLAVACGARQRRADEPAPARLPEERTAPDAPAATTPEERLEEARRAFEADPENEELTIWYGRRLAYVGRYDEALAVYTRGLERHPESHRLRRHRGHRYITTGRYALAVQDLEAAAELIADRPDAVEPDGLPNALGLPRSTDHFNVWYHLALARYLERDFAGAHAAWTACLGVSRNDDSVCASVYWLTLTCWRLDRPDEAERLRAAIRPDMDVIENTAYQRLLLCQEGTLPEEELWAGVAPGSVDEATIAYGLGCMRRARGDEEGARALFRRSVAAGVPQAFGAIAAAQELAVDWGTDG